MADLVRQAAASAAALVLLIAAVLWYPTEAAAQTNPFFSGGGESTAEDGSAEGGGITDPLRGLQASRNRFLGTIVSLQREIHGRLVELFRRRGLSSDPRPGGGVAAKGGTGGGGEAAGIGAVEGGDAGAGRPVVPLLLGFTLLYGMIHALGPGHRKTVLFSYFISAGGRWWHGIVAGIGLAVVHAGSALVAVFAIHSILQTTFSGSLNNVQRLMETISYLAITAMGVLLLLHAIRETREHVRHRHGGWNEADEGSVSKKEHSQESLRRTSRRRWSTGRRKLEPLFIVLSAGIVPCPGAATLLIFGITLQAVPLAIAGLLSMSLGMGITLSAVGVLTLTMKGGLLQLLGGGRRTERVATVLEVAGALFILLFGLFMGLPPLLAGL